MTQNRQALLPRLDTHHKSHSRISDDIAEQVFVALAEAADIAYAEILQDTFALTSEEAAVAKYLKVCTDLSQVDGPDGQTDIALDIYAHPAPLHMLLRSLVDRMPIPIMGRVKQPVASAVAEFHAVEGAPGSCWFELDAGITDLSAHKKLALLERHASGEAGT